MSYTTVFKLLTYDGIGTARNNGAEGSAQNELRVPGVTSSPLGKRTV